MVTNQNRITQQWLQLVQPALLGAEEAVLLGFGQGHHLHAILEKNPTLRFWIVEWNLETIANFGLHLQNSVGYVHTDNGLCHLKAHLLDSKNPIPILCYRPSWGTDRFRYESTYHFLIQSDFMNNCDMRRTEASQFILESLFV